MYVYDYTHYIIYAPCVSQNLDHTSSPSSLIAFGSYRRRRRSPGKNRDST